MPEIGLDYISLEAQRDIEGNHNHSVTCDYKIRIFFFSILRMQRTGWERPEKADGKRSRGKSFQSILRQCGLALFALQRFYHSRSAPIEGNSLDHLGQKAII